MKPLLPITATETQFRYGFAGHETFPFRYGWLKKAVDGVARDHLVFSRDDAIVVLGVGKNMVHRLLHPHVCAGAHERSVLASGHVRLSTG